MAPPPDDRDCGWKKYAEAQAAELALLKEKFDALEAAAEKRKTNTALRATRVETAELKPLHNAALKLVPAAADVHAAETSMRQQDLGGRAYI